MFLSSDMFSGFTRVARIFASMYVAAPVLSIRIGQVLKMFSLVYSLQFTEYTYVYSTVYSVYRYRT